MKGQTKLEMGIFVPFCFVNLSFLKDVTLKNSFAYIISKHSLLFSGNKVTLRIGRKFFKAMASIPGTPPIK